MKVLDQQEKVSITLEIIPGESENTLTPVSVYGPCTWCNDYDKCPGWSGGP
jgi:hypothetical protein